MGGAMVPGMGGPFVGGMNHPGGNAGTTFWDLPGDGPGRTDVYDDFDSCHSGCCRSPRIAYCRHPTPGRRRPGGLCSCQLHEEDYFGDFDVAGHYGGGFGYRYPLDGLHKHSIYGYDY